MAPAIWQGGSERACLGEHTIPAGIWDHYKNMSLLLSCWASLGGGETNFIPAWGPAGWWQADPQLWVEILAGKGRS